MQLHPPKVPLKFLRWFCREDYLEEIEGNLMEEFERDAEQNVRKAQWYFCRQVLFHFRPDFIKAFQSNLITTAMLKHNLLISYRGFLRNKLSFAINLIGLATGLACAMLMFLWIQHELSVDGFHEKGDHLQQVLLNYPRQDEVITSSATPGILGEAVVDAIPEVKAAVTLNNEIFKPEGIIALEEGGVQAEGLYASENLFEVLTFPLLKGDTKTALGDLYSVAISESLAKKVFGSVEVAMGKRLKWTYKVDGEFQENDFQVSAIFKDVLPTSTKQFDLVIRYDWLVNADKYAWEWNGGYAETLLWLEDGAEIEEVNGKLTALLNANLPARNKAKNKSIILQPFSERYLYGQYENGQIAGGRISYVRLFLLIVVFILSIACINFMNLSTAHATVKMKEIGVKKTIGIGRKSIIGRFYIEAFLLTILGAILAVGIVIALFPQFNQLTGYTLYEGVWKDIIPLFLGIILFTALLSGSYPAFYLSAFKPIQVLKGRLSRGKSEKRIRQGLVVFQFSITMIFLLGVLVINQQMKYTQERYLGFNRNNVLTFQLGNGEHEPATFLSAIESIPGIENSANMVWSIFTGYDSQGGYSWTGDPAEKKISFKAPRIGYNVIETLEMEVVQGRSFSKELGDTWDQILINESALEIMDLDDPIGKVIQYGDGQVEIIGVVSDFQYGSLHEPIVPLIFRFRRMGQDILLRVKAGTEEQTLAMVEEVYKEFYPKETFEYSFMDASYQNLYISEQRVATLAKSASILTILISCLGLLGLVTFTAQKRAKEIGIRKVMGASEWKIISLLSTDFTRMVLLAMLIGLPIGYLALNQWLNSFAYKIELNWTYFGLTALIALLMAWLAVSFQTVRAAKLNPVQFLRDE